ncbi:hypothetical protein WJX81_007855 [Elliptochloris bilobata]|uniref:MSP domain-containing protein n=1 Tax=Elliptochloris bilobata TaxID=381761 RepID=A0AAW1QLB1_9CHLO
MSDTSTHLSISPTELKFRFELRKNIPVTISLQNPTGEKVAFKVKTTSPKKYCVRPSSGYVDAGGHKDVQVIMQAQKEYPPSLADCKDKFLVQSVKVGPEVMEATPDLFDPAKGQDIKQVKLRVVLVGIKPPSPVPEGVEEEALSPGRNAFRENGAAAAEAGSAAARSSAPAPAAGPADDLAAVTRERNKLRDSLARVEKERGDVAKRLEQLEADRRTRGATAQLRAELGWLALLAALAPGLGLGDW